MTNGNAPPPAAIRLLRSLAAWGTPRFAATLKAELEAVDPGSLPLQEALTSSSAVAPGGFTVMVRGATADAEALRVNAGIFYAGIIGGCSCADDPTPVNEQDEYCQVRIDIDRRTAQARIALVDP
jgi:hypothetical protein